MVMVLTILGCVEAIKMLITHGQSFVFCLIFNIWLFANKLFFPLVVNESHPTKLTNLMSHICSQPGLPVTKAFTKTCM